MRYATRVGRCKYAQVLLIKFETRALWGSYPSVTLPHNARPMDEHGHKRGSIPLPYDGYERRPSNFVITTMSRAYSKSVIYNINIF